MGILLHWFGLTADRQYLLHTAAALSQCWRASFAVFFWRQKVDSLGLVSAILLKGHSWQTHKKWLMFNGSRSFEIKLDIKYLEDKAQCMFSPEIEVCFCRKSPKMYLILGIWKMFFEIQYLRFPVFFRSESWCRWVFFCAGLIWLLTGITCCGQLVSVVGRGFLVNLIGANYR